jgi:ligand-binding sensor domain-containing protein
MLSRKQIFIAILLIAFHANAQWVKTSGPQGMNVNCFYGVGNTLFAGTSAKGVFRSANSGTSWQASNTNIENNTVFSMIAKDGFLFAGTNDGVYRSADNGATWQPFNTNMLGKFVVSLYVANNFIYAGTVGTGLFKSMIMHKAGLMQMEAH